MRHLRPADMAYHGTVRARHILDVLVNDMGYETIQSKVKKNLKGMKVAPYYGCQVVRPRFGFDNTEQPNPWINWWSVWGECLFPFL